MSGVSGQIAGQASQINRNELRLTETDFGETLKDIVKSLYPPPNTAAQFAAELHCSVRLIELYMQGKQPWSGDAIAFIVAEILRRHHMRNFKVVKRG
jgi:hypothetical protein